MDFLKLLRSAEDALYELMMWLLLYPLTLWRILRHPARLEAKIREELGQNDEQRFDDAISPPMCLLASLAVSMLVPDSSSSENLNTLARWLTSNIYNEWLALAALFALLPLAYATATLLRQRLPIRRDNLRLPFYTHAWLVSPPALLLALFLLIFDYLPALTSSFAIGAGFILIWYARAVISTLMRTGGYRLLPACLVFLAGIILTLLVAFALLIVMVLEPADLARLKAA
ncbi:hypothetical protein CO614_08485 [Lysobacteraceae bacterium NML120232]|nr:hypothetical protein CO614_08485 [Xanthomonadaceae bacterium NML120232]